MVECNQGRHGIGLLQFPIFSELPMMAWPAALVRGTQCVLFGDRTSIPELYLSINLPIPILAPVLAISSSIIFFVWVHFLQVTNKPFIWV